MGIYRYLTHPASKVHDATTKGTEQGQTRQEQVTHTDTKVLSVCSLAPISRVLVVFFVGAAGLY